MKCPICQRPVKSTDPEAPFCGDRCREIDLDNWATGKYVISSPVEHLDEISLDDEDDA